MADQKISQLTSATTPLAGTEVLPIVQSGSTVKVSVANLTAGRAVASAGGTFSDNFTQGTAAKGVNFTANTPAAGMTSQLLNWYEEGTWTPSLGGTTTYAAQAGRYTRIGRVVYFQCTLSITSIGTGSTTQISGLPFTSANNSAYGGHAIYYDGIDSNVSQIVGYIGTTNIVLQSTTAFANSIGPNSIFKNGTNLTFQGFYFV
jgi:hypothetical protein